MCLIHRPIFLEPKCRERVEESEASDHSEASDGSDDEGEFMLVIRNVVAPTTLEYNKESPTNVAPTVQPRHCSLVSAAPSSAPRNDAPCCPHSVNSLICPTMLILIY